MKTAEELKTIRNRAVTYIKQYDMMCLDEFKDQMTEDQYKAEETKIQTTQIQFTCDNCSDRFHCTHVFDNYNQNGDCIASK